MNSSQMKTILFLASITLMNTGCASYFLRKKCEDTNWFNHAQGVAKSGKHLEEDEFLGQCRKVEAEISSTQLDLGFKKGRATYCTTDGSYQTGKSGDSFQATMCEGENLKKLRASYQEGLGEYCGRDNGFLAGSSGKKYQNVCPKNLEIGFLPEYRKGRKQYLVEIINAKSEEIRALDTEVSDIEKQKQGLNRQLADLNRRISFTRKTSYSYNSGMGQKSDEISIGETDRTQEQKDELTRDIQNLDYQINQKRSQQSKLRQEMSEVRTEIAGLTST